MKTNFRECGPGRPATGERSRAGGRTSRPPYPPRRRHQRRLERENLNAKRTFGIGANACIHTPLLNFDRAVNERTSIGNGQHCSRPNNKAMNIKISSVWTRRRTSPVTRHPPPCPRVPAVHQWCRSSAMRRRRSAPPLSELPWCLDAWSLELLWCLDVGAWSFHHPSPVRLPRRSAGGSILNRKSSKRGRGSAPPGQNENVAGCCTPVAGNVAPLIPDYQRCNGCYTLSDFIYDLITMSWPCLLRAWLSQRNGQALPCHSSQLHHSWLPRTARHPLFTGIFTANWRNQLIFK
jgi:hypothetical protein